MTHAEQMCQHLRQRGWAGGTFGVLSYDNGSMSMDFDPDPTDGRSGDQFGLTLAGPAGGLQLFVEFGDDPGPVLDAVVGFQASVTPDNFGEHVRSLLAVARAVYVMADEDSDPAPVTLDWVPDHQVDRMTTHCCETMTRQLETDCPNHSGPFECADSLVHFNPRHREYGLIIHDGGRSVVVIAFCPWCGARLPESQRGR